MTKPVENHRLKAPKSLRYAVFVVSSSRYEAVVHGKSYSDETGDIAVDLIKRSGNEVTTREIVPDEREAISSKVKQSAGRVDVVLLCGGTGLHPKDLTPEVVRPLFEKEIQGFGELFRGLSYREVGPAAMLSRASAGMIHGTAVFCLPGSPKGVELALKELILPEAGHICWVAKGYKD